MPELPRISGKKAIKIFKKLGFTQVRQKGSHVVMRRKDKGCVIPWHKELALGTLKSVIKPVSRLMNSIVPSTKKQKKAFDILPRPNF